MRCSDDELLLLWVYNPVCDVTVFEGALVKGLEDVDPTLPSAFDWAFHTSADIIVAASDNTTATDFFATPMPPVELTNAPTGTPTPSLLPTITDMPTVLPNCTGPVTPFETSFMLDLNGPIDQATPADIELLEGALLDAYNAVVGCDQPGAFIELKSVEISIVSSSPESSLSRPFTLQVQFEGECLGCSTTPPTLFHEGDALPSSGSCQCDLPFVEAYILECNDLLQNAPSLSDFALERATRLVGGSGVGAGPLQTFSADIVVTGVSSSGGGGGRGGGGGGGGGGVGNMTDDDLQTLGEAFAAAYNSKNAFNYKVCDKESRLITTVIPVIQEASEQPSSPWSILFRITGTCSGCGQTAVIFGNHDDTTRRLQDTTLSTLCPVEADFRCPSETEFLDAFQETIDRLKEEGSLTTIEKVSDTVSTGGVIGDPHIERWNKKSFDFHGECDLVMLHSDHVNHNRSLDLHIRTTIRSFYSSIEEAALRVGNVTLQMDSYKFYFEGRELDETAFPFEREEFTIHAPVYDIEKKHRRTYAIALDDKNIISVRKTKSFLSIVVQGHAYQFADACGLLGDFRTGNAIGRDGRRIEDWEEYGMEWQVGTNDPSLFQVMREPQLPHAKCKMPSMKQQSGRYLRSKKENRALETQARAACKSAGKDLDACMSDVMTTGDLAFAEAW